jgi:hypothetical protein|tara:strand:- start:413 stop:604 length:192 start_codon:yes stop_codon:yes gene_type:complete
MSKIQQRMAQLMQPIHKQIMLCDTREETMMLACVMLQSTFNILNASIGSEGRKEIITEANEKD